MKSDLIFLVSSASGVGKTTLCNMLRKKYKEIGESISATTRKMRPGEKDGVDYFFLTEEEFDQMVKEEKFVEHATVYDHRYGTLKSEIERIWKEEKVPLFEIDWQGARQMRKSLADRTLVTVYFLPPSVQTVYDRLRGRQTDDIKVVKDRMSLLIDDINHAPEYDYVMVNDNLQQAFENLSIVYQAAKLKSGTKIGADKLIQRLKEEKVKW